MARINIEDDLFKKKGFEKLMLKLGSKRSALGALIEAWMLAQKHYLNEENDRLIPFDEWESEEISDEIISCGLAEKKSKGVYIKGSEDQFSWLLQKQEAGKKGGRPKNQAENSKPSETERLSSESGSNPLTLPLSLSSISFSSSNSNSNNIFVDNESKKADESGRKREVSTKVSKAALCGIRSEFEHESSIGELLSKVKLQTQGLWIDTYKNIPWIIFELKKAQAWIVENPDRAPKSRFGVFCSNWLSRGFENYRKTLQGNKPRGNWVEEHNRKVMQSLEEMDSQEKVVKSES